MAFLVVILWHIYNAHLSPDVFPFDKSIFTGKISLERMEHEHPLELARIRESGEVRQG
jgi:formate dehydrogenase subunit gamma